MKSATSCENILTSQKVVFFLALDLTLFFCPKLLMAPGVLEILNVLFRSDGVLEIPNDLICLSSMPTWGPDPRIEKPLHYRLLMSFSLNFYCPTAVLCQSSVIFEAAQTGREVSHCLTDAICYDSAFKCPPLITTNTCSNTPCCGNMIFISPLSQIKYFKI